jgi:seryl-tRNA synthetase
MLDIKYIQNNSDQVKKLLAGKGVSSNQVDKTLAAYENFKLALQKVEEAKAEQNRVSKLIPTLQGEEKQKVLGEMKELSANKKANDEALEKAKFDYEDLLSELPNIPFAQVPVGASDEENIVARKEGEIRDWKQLGFEPKEHWELAENLDLLDMERGAKVSGSRFYYLKKELAVLQMALMNWAFLEIAKRGFSPTIPPVMVRAEAMNGTGYLSKADSDQLYRVNPENDDLYLVGTSEVPLMAYHSDEILDEAQLPIKFAGSSTCFRREAGSAGKDTKGILRVHQFEKIEMVAICTPEQAEKIHEELREMEEYLLKQLGIPYQVIDICTGDLGFSAAKKYDLEAWLPGQKAYREMTSTSNCTDFQTRRLKIRYRDSEGKVQTAYSLNGTAVSSRPLIAIFENFQNADGSIDIPEVLVPFTGFSKIEAKK